MTDIPQGFKFVAAALVSSTFLLQVQVIAVMRARRRAGIPYPQLYAEKAETEANPEALRFNCVQRAHQNTLENMPLVIIGTLITGLRFPMYATCACGLFVFGKALYSIGYASGDPHKRVSRGGILGSVGTVALWFGSLAAVWSWFFMPEW